MLSAMTKCKGCGAQVASWLFCLRCPDLDVCFLCYAGNAPVSSSHDWDSHPMQCYPQGNQLLNGLGQTTIYTLSCPLCHNPYSSLTDYRNHIYSTHDNATDREESITCPVCTVHCKDIISHQLAGVCDEMKLMSDETVEIPSNSTLSLSGLYDDRRMSTILSELKSDFNDEKGCQVTPPMFLPLPPLKLDENKAVNLKSNKMSLPITDQLFNIITDLWFLLHRHFSSHLITEKVKNHNNKICNLLERLMVHVACCDKRVISTADIDNILNDVKKSFSKSQSTSKSDNGGGGGGKSTCLTMSSFIDINAGSSTIFGPNPMPFSNTVRDFIRLQLKSGTENVTAIDNSKNIPKDEINKEIEKSQLDCDRVMGLIAKVLF